MGRRSEQLAGVAPEEMKAAVYKLLRETIKDHKKVIFNGNGYTEEWVEEAKRRGLYNLTSTPEALPEFISSKNLALFTKHSIFTREEVLSRYEILMENYVKTLHIEALTMVEMVSKDVLPALLTYMDEIAKTAKNKKSISAALSIAYEERLLTVLSGYAETIHDGLRDLSAKTEEAQAISDTKEQAVFYHDVVLAKMSDVRLSVDAAEAMIPDGILPYPTYGKLLFTVV